MTTSFTVDTNKQGIATITLSRPERHNAFDDEMILELTQAIKKLDNDSSVNFIVLAAAGKSFSAGADLNWMKKMASYDWHDNYYDSMQLANLMKTLHHCQKITIALVQGAAFGGGVGLVACCDIALATQSAKFCLSEVKLGLIPAVISPYVLKAIGERNSRYYFATAEVFDANKAEQMNLIHKVFADDSFTDDAKTFIGKMLTNSPKAVMATKELIKLVNRQPINEKLMEQTAKRIADIRASDEGKEGVSAFLEKRKPDWINKD
ncbi:MAG: enoyl-CoA hydratase/isomerase family protein [Gammaproteobacteria bacterium]|nr:enoyl-CoA hydratase/isomerase family protein [Gammaproteobacteria bacterium]